MRRLTASVVLAALFLAIPGPAFYQAWAGEFVVDAAGARTPASGLVAGAITDSLNVYLSQRGNQLPEVLSVESQIKAAYFLEQLHALSPQQAAELPSLEPTATVSPDQARASLLAVDEVLKTINWHDLHDPKFIQKAIAELAPRLPANAPPSSQDKLETIVKVLRPALNSTTENPWDEIFENAKKRAAAEAVPVAASGLVSRSDPHFRAVALDIMTAGSLHLSRTAAMGRIYTAHGKTHEQVRDLATTNFRHTAEFVLDNVDALPLNEATASRLNHMLTEGGLMPEEVRGNMYYNGDAKFHEEERQFYAWLSSDKGAAFAAEHPVELAERVHYVISHFDAALDSNGRTARLMADLVLLKAGLAPVFYMGGIGDYFQRGSVRSGVTPQTRLAYFREMSDNGQRMMAQAVSYKHHLEDPLAHLEPAGGVAEHIKNQEGYQAVPAVPEVRASVADFIRMTEARQAEQQSVWTKIRKGLAGFSSSYWRLASGIGILEGVSIAMAATMAIFGISQFGLAWGIAATSLSTLTRIPGSALAAKVKQRFNPKQIYVASIILNFAQIIMLPIGLALFGHGLAYLGVFMASQALYGLVWGATQGVAESTIMPRVVGQDQKTLSTAKLMLMALKTISSLVFAFGVGPLLAATVGLNASIVIYAGIVLATLPLFLSVKLRGTPPPTQAASAATVERPQAAQPLKTRLTLREALPYIATMFLVMAFYTVFVGNFSLFRFNDAAAGVATAHTRLLSLLAIGFYNLGGAIISMSATIPKLISSFDTERAELPAKGTPSEGPASLKKWFGALVLGTAFYLWTGMAGLTWLNVGLASTALGVVAAINRSQWPAYYMSENSGLAPASRENEMARLIGWATKLTFLPFGILSIGKLLGYPAVPLLLASAVLVALVMAVSWLVAGRHKNGGAPSRR